MADFDGDGLADMVELRSLTQPTGTVLYVYSFQNRGDGRFGLNGTTPDACGQYAGLPQVALAVDPSSTKLADISATPGTGLIGIHDLTGDGHADVVSLTSAGVFLFPWIGPGTFGNAIQAVGNFVSSPFDVNQQAILFADADQSGVDDLIVSRGTFANRIDFTTGQRSGLLSSITSFSTGLSTTLTYGSLAAVGAAASPPWSVPVAGTVVTSMTTSNSITGQFAQQYSSTYRYELPVYDARDKAFAGFQTVTETKNGDATAPGTKVRTSFATHTCTTASGQPPAPGQPCPATLDYVARLGRGVPYLIEVETADPATHKHLSTTLISYPRTITLHGLDGRLSRRMWRGVVDSYVTDYWDPAGASGSTVDIFPETNVNIPSAGSYPVPVVLPPATASRHLRQAYVYDYYAGAPTRVDDYEVAASGQPTGSPIATTTTWALPSGDTTGWNYRPTVVTTQTGFATSAVRELDLTWTNRGQLLTMAAPVSGGVGLVRAPGGALPPTGMSVNGTTPTLRALTYDGFGNVQTIVEPGTRCTKIFYDPQYAQLPLKTTVDPSTNVAPAASCGLGQLTTTRNFDRGLEALTEEVSPADERTIRAYDGFGRLTEIDQPSALSPHFTATWPAVKIDYHPGFVTLVHVQTQIGFLSEQYSEQWTYSDGFGHTLASLQSDDAPSTASGWVVSGRVIRTANGRVSQAYAPTRYTGAGNAYDINSAPVAMSTSYTYTDRGQPLKATAFDGTVTTYVPHPLAFSVDVIGPEQPLAYTTYTRDEHGRTASVDQHIAFNPAPGEVITTSYSYAPTGEVLTRKLTHSSVPTDAVTHTFVYDSLGRMVQSKEPNTGTWSYAYNDHGDLVGTVDPRGCGKNIAYDPIGRISFEDYSPCVANTQFLYTPPSPTSDAGKEKVYKYDQLVGAGPTPLGSYNGRLTAILDRAQVSMFDYDPRGRVTHIRRQLSTPGAGSVGSYAPHVYDQFVQDYDEANRPVNLRTGADDPSLLVGGTSVESFQYTPRGNISRVSSSYGALLSSQTFDEFGAVRTQVLGDAAGTTLNTTYLNGRVDTFSIQRPATWSPLPGLPYTPPAVGSPNTREGDLTNLAFSYYPSGNVKKITDTNANWPAYTKPPTRTMTYDDLFRLQRIDTDYLGVNDTFSSPIMSAEKPLLTPVDSSPSGNRIRQESFTYDWKGNLTSADDNEHVFDRAPGTLNYAGSLPHQLTTSATIATPSVTTAPAYDAAGNITSIVVTRGSSCGAHPCFERYTYTWNEVGQLETAARDYRLVIGGKVTWFKEANITYTYDAGGSRVLKAVTDPAVGTPTYTANIFGTLRLENATFSGGDYQHDSTTERVLLPVAQGVTARVQVVANDIPSGMSGVRRVFFELGDKLGSTSFVIEQQTGEVVERATYEGYGKTESDFRPDRWNNFRETDRYTGKSDDAEVGVTYFGGRYYSTVLQRWLSPDPLAVHTSRGDMNVYGFVGGSPTMFTDPDGLNPTGCDDMSAGCGGGGGGGGFDISDLIGRFGLWILGGGGGGSALPGAGGSPAGPAWKSAPQTPSNVRATDEEALSVVPAALQNAGVGATEALLNGALAHLVGGHFASALVSRYLPHISLSEWRAEAPPENPTNVRDRSLRRSYDAFNGALMGLGIGVAVALGGAVLVEGMPAIEGSAAEAINGPRLAAQLAREEAESAFTASGELSQEAIQGAKQIIPPEELINPAIPQGVGKFSTQTFNSPSGPFQVHFYMNPATRQPFYGLDFKAIFNSGTGATPFRPFSGSAP
jgi:RHS repeat-associated protein